MIFTLALVVHFVYQPTVWANDTVVKDLGGEPSYSLLIQTSNTQLNHGDPFKIEIKISGLGDVNISKIIVSISAYLPKNENVNLTVINFTRYYLNNIQKLHSEPVVIKKPPEFWVLVPDVVYNLTGINEEDIFLGPKPSGASPLSIGEAIAPFVIDFVVADNAPYGDHEIGIVYNYKTTKESGIRINRL